MPVRGVVTPKTGRGASRPESLAATGVLGPDGPPPPPSMSKPLSSLNSRDSGVSSAPAEAHRRRQPPRHTWRSGEERGV